MPIIIDKQKQLHEVARIRIGEQVPVMDGKTQKTYKDGSPMFRPTMRETFRLTSVDKAMLEAAHATFDGELRQWEGHPGQWELLTERTQLKAIIHLQHSLSEDFEMWSGGGCQRRCDGVECKTPGAEGYIVQPCLCPKVDKEREDLASKGKACKMTTRLNVLLSEVPALGMWRLESHGKIFNSEVTAAIEMMGIVGLGNGEPVYCVLTIAQQEIKKPGQPARKFSIPKLTLDPKPIDFKSLIARSQTAELPAGSAALPGPSHSVSSAPSLPRATQTPPEPKTQRAVSATQKQADDYLAAFELTSEEIARVAEWKKGCAERQESWAKKLLEIQAQVPARSDSVEALMAALFPTDPSDSDPDAPVPEGIDAGNPSGEAPTIDPTPYQPDIAGQGALV